jgi:metal-responsive CopG/Arc/MetJ family transcriptional regulator
MNAPTSVTIQIRIDSDLLADVMRAVERAGPEWDRSAWIREAIRAALAAAKK